MVVAEKMKEAEITEQDSMLLIRNLLRIGIFNISYIRGLFPDKYFSDKSVPALDMKIKKLMPMDPESRRLIDWMEEGVYDALQKKYLKTLLFCICEGIESPMIEEYAFSFNYSNSNSQEVAMKVSRIGNKRQGATFKSNEATDVTPNQMRSSACKMVRTLVELMRTFDRMPEERTILMKLLYYDDVTPVDYEPPFFRGCSGQEANNTWTKNPLKMEVGSINNKHFVLALKVKSILDPCEDENNLQDDDVSLGADSVQRDDSSESDSEVNQSLEEDHYVVAPAGKERSFEDNSNVDEMSEDTQDTEEDSHQFARVKDWINAHHIDKVELTDVLSVFPDISMTLTEEIMAKLVDEGLLSKDGRDAYSITKRKDSDIHLNDVKEETEAQERTDGKKVNKKKDEDYMYMKALYHALPMNYVTITKLQTKLDGEANQSTVRKLIDKMAQDGYLEGTNNRRLGRRVVHSELTEKKLLEVKNALGNNSEPMEICEPENRTDNLGFIATGNGHRNTSTCGGFHSIGFDITCTRGNSDTQHNGSIRSEQNTGQKAEGSTAMDMLEVFSRKRHKAANGRSHYDDADGTIGRRSTQDKRTRKTSTVTEPVQKRKRFQGVIIKKEQVPVHCTTIIASVLTNSVYVAFDGRVSCYNRETPSPNAEDGDYEDADFKNDEFIIYEAQEEKCLRINHNILLISGDAEVLKRLTGYLTDKGDLKFEDAKNIIKKYLEVMKKKGVSASIGVILIGFARKAKACSLFISPRLKRPQIRIGKEASTLFLGTGGVPAQQFFDTDKTEVELSRTLLKSVVRAAMIDVYTGGLLRVYEISKETDRAIEKGKHVLMMLHEFRGMMQKYLCKGVFVSVTMNEYDPKKEVNFRRVLFEALDSKEISVVLMGVFGSKREPESKALLDCMLIYYVEFETTEDMHQIINEELRFQGHTGRVFQHFTDQDVEKMERAIEKGFYL